MFLNIIIYQIYLKQRYYSVLEASQNNLTNVHDIHFQNGSQNARDLLFSKGL